MVFEGRDIKKWRNVYALRRRIGVVFPLPVGLPLSVYDNVACRPARGGTKNKAELDVIVERCLTRAALWDEVKDRLDSLGSLLSGGQQQRLDHRPGPLPGSRPAAARRVLHRRRPGDHHAHRRCAQGTQKRDHHHPGDQPRPASPPPGRPHCLLPEWGDGGSRRQTPKTSSSATWKTNAPVTMWRDALADQHRT